MNRFLKNPHLIDRMSNGMLHRAMYVPDCLRQDRIDYWVVAKLKSGKTILFFDRYVGAKSAVENGDVNDILALLEKSILDFIKNNYDDSLFCKDFDGEWHESKVVNFNNNEELF